MLCDDLEKWDREGGREAQEGRDMEIYVCILLIQFIVQQKLRSIVKQLYSNKGLFLKVFQ